MKNSGVIVAEKKNRAVYGVLIMVFLFFLILMIFASYTIKVFNNENDAMTSLSKGKGKIAVVEINGVIMEARPTIELLVRAEEDENVKAIILRINSPGGAVGPTQEIFEEIRRIDGAWDKTKNKEGNLFMEVLEQLLPVGVTIWARRLEEFMLHQEH